MGNWEFYDRHFGEARLRHYLRHCSGDQQCAMELYRWNVATSAAFWESFAYFEVAFRNAVDARMCDRHARLGRSGHWVFDEARELGRDAEAPGRHRQPYLDVDRAKARVRRNKKRLDPGQIISELPFGFWHQMVSRKQMFLWPDIASGFPHAPSRDQKAVNLPVQRLREFRNRIGHHHRIWSEDVTRRYADLLAVAGFLDPELRSFIDGHSRVRMMLRRESQWAARGGAEGTNPRSAAQSATSRPADRVGRPQFGSLRPAGNPAGLEASLRVGFEVVLVHAVDEHAAAFYGKCGFTPFADRPRHLYMTTRQLRATLGA